MLTRLALNLERSICLLMCHHAWLTLKFFLKFCVLRCFTWLIRMPIHHLYDLCLHWPQKGIGFLELELQMVVSQHVGAGNWILFLWKSSSHCFYSLNGFSSPFPSTSNCVLFFRLLILPPYSKFSERVECADGMYVCMCILIHVYVHTCTHIYTYIHAHMCVHKEREDLG